MHPIVVLATGLRVANFSSPHPFAFASGEVLPACAPDTARGLMLEAVEETTASTCGRWTDIALEFRMNASVAEALINLAEREDVDVILVPLPVQTALKMAAASQPELWVSALRKARVVRVADRVAKTIFADRFCR